MNGEQTSHRQPPRPARRWWMVLLVSSAGITVTGAGFVAWEKYHLPARVEAALPPLPELQRRPAVLVELLAKAHAQARSRENPLEGVATLGRLYHANGYLAEAEACWRILKHEQPREARWCYYLADLRRTASDYAELTPLLERTVELAPNYSPAWLQLAGLNFKTGRMEDAERQYAERLKLVPGDPYARLGLARIAQQRGQIDEARRQIESLVKDAPNFSPGHNLYAEMLEAAGETKTASQQRFFGRETGRFRDAEDPWLEELRQWCYDFDRLCVLATMQYQVEAGDRGKSYLERAVALDPTNVAGYEMLGSLYLKLGEPAKARETLEKGLAIATTEKPSAMAYVDLSRAFRALGQPIEAVRVTREGLTRLGDQFELHDALGVAFAEMNQQDEAIRAFRSALALNPNDPNANLNLGVSLLVVGRKDEATEAIKRSLTLQPTFPKALSLLGRLSLESSDWKNAGRYLLPLFESHPENAEARALLSEWHLRAGQAAEAEQNLAGAEKHYRDGLVLNGGRAELNAGLGVLCLIQGRVDDAREPLEKYHQARPDDPLSSLFLGQVYLQLGRVAEAQKVLTEGKRLAEKEGQTSTVAHFREMLEHL